MNHMKMKKLFAVLLASSLASTASNGASELEDQYKDQYEDQYYAGLNFGVGWGNSFKMKPSVVFGYNYDKYSKFELEVLTDISNIADKVKRKIGASLLANYRYYPDLDIGPVKLYVSGGLGGYLQIIPFSFGVSDKVGGEGGNEVGGEGGNEVGGEGGNEVGGEGGNEVGGEGGNEVGGEGGNEVGGKVMSNDSKKEVSEAPALAADSSLVDKILGSVSYKLKVGVDYEITPQIVGAVGVTAGGQLSGIKALQIPDATLEVGIRYNF